MAEFQRKQVPFFHRGMNWNSPIEKLADGQLNWAKNVRVLEQGTISTAHGYTQMYSFPINYVHSMSRLNVLNPAYNQHFRRTFVYGGDTQLFVFQDQTTLADSHLNPVTTPLGRSQEAVGGTVQDFSGNPLSVVDAQPANGSVAWKYIADSLQMCTVGYYPSDGDGTMARALTMGMLPPIMNTNVVLGAGRIGTGGGYAWMFAFRRTQTGARSNPSAATRISATTPFYTLTSQNATMTLPTTPVDPQTGAFDTNVVVDVYRYGGDVLRWALVGSGPGGSVFVDNVPDIQLLAAPSPPQATDASTGLSRFNLFMPFVTPDIAWSGQATAHLGNFYAGAPAGNNVWQLWRTSGPLFNINWLPGSTIFVGTTAFTIYQVISDTVIELAEDASVALTAGTEYTWSTSSGTLMAGQPLPHLWGVLGIGQSGSYLFACGDPHSPGSLYWTNGNDPDSTDIVNNIQVTSPSEKLVTGCVYAGQSYCWSTERMFGIYPSLTIFGQFTTQEMPGAKGVWVEWALTTQSNGLSDQSVTWRGKDGIYDFSSNGLQRLTDPLYAFFPHDGGWGLAPETILPFIGPNSLFPEAVGDLDDTQPKYHHLTWFQGLLFYDFIGLTADREKPAWSTLVWDSINIPGGGWVCVDQPFVDTAHPISRGIDIGSNDPLGHDADLEPGPIFGPMARGGNMKVSWGNLVYDYFGYTRGFESRVMTRAEDLGDSRAQKRWGDFWLDCTPLDVFTVYPLAGFHRCPMKPIDVPSAATAITPDFCANPTEPDTRAQWILDFQEFTNSDGASLLSPTLGLDIHWHGIDGQFVASLNQWQPSFVVKPEIISFRASDPDDLGALQAKYFTGLNLQANTFGQTLQLNVLIDNVLAATLPVNHADQSEHPYAFTPKAGYQTQLQMQFPQAVAGEPPTWQLFKISWIYEVWPDSVARDSFFTDLGYTGSKFIQGMVVPMETGGAPVTFNVNGDCGQRATMGPVSTPNLCKMDLAFSFGPCNTSPSDPFIASSVQIIPNNAARIWYDNIKWIWEPEPELVSTWLTQPTDHDFATWHHHRDCFIAYRGGNGTPTLYITTEYGTEAYPLDPVTQNQYVRCYRVLKPQKAKWRYYRVEGCGLFRLYIKDSSVRVKEWGSTGPYINAQPFGDLSRANGGARI